MDKLPVLEWGLFRQVPAMRGMSEAWIGEGCTLTLLGFGTRDGSGNGAAVFEIGGFPPATGIDVVVKHDASGPIRFARTGADVIENEDGGIPGEFHGARNWKLHFPVSIFENRDDGPFAPITLFNAGDAVAVVPFFRAEAALSH